MLSLSAASAAFAGGQETSSFPANAAPTDNFSPQAPLNPEQLIESLNQRFLSDGIRFFPLESTGDTLRPVDVVEIEDLVIDPHNVLQVANEDELIKAIEDFYRTTRESETASNSSRAESESTITEGPTRSVEPLSLTDHYAVASWYEFACGPQAWFTGGVFCWKNIGYTYQIDDVQRSVRNPAVTDSWVSGLNIMSWHHSYGSASSINSRTVQLQTWGYYVLGIQIQGFTIGATWNGYWSRTVNPPCAICQ